jgi:hypothetical protein
MPEIWKAQSTLVYNNWINSIIEESSDKLNEWETDFLDSLQNRLNRGNNLTQNQAEILERIYIRYTS